MFSLNKKNEKVYSGYSNELKIDNSKIRKMKKHFL